MGAAVSVVDFDRDGLPDLYVTNSKEGSKNRLYRNRGDGTFEDVAERLGVADLNHAETGVSMGAVWGDYDNDGFEDLFLYRWGRPELFHNDARQGLHARHRDDGPAGLGQRQRGRLARLRPRRPARPLPRRLLPRVGQPLEARRHEDDAGELRVREQRRPEVPLPQPRRRTVRRGQRAGRPRVAALGARRVAADLRGTGYPDLFIANDYGVSELFVNEGGHFREVGRDDRRRLRAEERHERLGRRRAQPGTLRRLRVEHLRGRHPAPGQQPLGADRPVRPACRSTRTWRGRWASSSAAGASARSSAISTTTASSTSTSSTATSRRRQQDSYWYDYSKIAGGNQIVISDAKNWPAMGTRSLAGYQQKKVWINDGAGRFLDVAQMVGVTDRYDGRSVALADLGEPRRARRRRGQPARAAAALSQRGGARPRLDRLRARRRLPVGCAPTGCTNRSAIGAQVTVFWNGQQQVQEVSGRIGLLRAEPAAAALRPGRRRGGRTRSSSAGRPVRCRS